MRHYRRDTSKERFPIEPAAFEKKPSNRILLIGWDTEYQLKTETENEVISYQYAAAILESDQTSKPVRWEGIIIPPRDGYRIWIADLVSIVVSEISSDRKIVLPTSIYLVGHFTRADLPGFSDFKNPKAQKGLNLDGVRNSYINVTQPISINVQSIDGKKGSTKVDLKVTIRDTMLIAAGGKGLSDIGDLVGIPKMILDKDPQKELKLKQTMRTVRDQRWKLFREYAMTDARICREYAIRIIRQNQTLTGEFKIPITLSALGVRLLENFWKRKGQDVTKMSGREYVVKSSYNLETRRTYKKQQTVLLEELHDNENLLSSCYHGGRNEQFQFGPLSRGEWVDYDIKSAYLTAMSMIGAPDWKKIRPIIDTKELLSYRPVELAFARIDFEFTGAVKFPCLPVRTENGLIFPRRGTTHVPIAEIQLARHMGAKIELKQGLFIPTDRSVEGRPFLDFAKDCLVRRQDHEKGTLENAFWKEIVNSTYGKTAQGIQAKRLYDLRTGTTKELPPCSITNPAYAAFISGFCRATVSEILDRLGADRQVCSVTTDGFLSQVFEPEKEAHEIELATLGTMGHWYKEARGLLSDDATILEVKHRAKRVLGWRTRGQATLEPSGDVILAKAGIKTPSSYDTPALENDYIVDLFLKRTPETTLIETRLTGSREMYEDQLDLVPEQIEKRLSMEYDWKRRPIYAGDIEFIRNGTKHTHLWFDTVPYESIDEHRATREWWDSFNSNRRRCLKSVADMKEWIDFQTVQGSPQKVLNRRYIRGDALGKLRRQLAIAYKNAEAGMRRSDQKMVRAGIFVEWLNKAGIECNRPNIWDDWKNRSATFEPHQVPRNPVTLKACEDLKSRFRDMDSDQILELE